MPFLNWIFLCCSLVIAGWAGWRTLRDQPVILRQLIAAGIVLAGLLITMIVAVVQVAQGHPVGDPVTFWGYYIAGAVLFPLAGVWAIAERSRWSSVVLVIAAIAFAVVQLRLIQLWGVS